MIDSIDSYLIGLDFDVEELQAIRHRGPLYFGITSVTLFALLFTALAIANIT